MLPIIILSVTGVINLFLGFSVKKENLQWLAVLFFAVALAGFVLEPAQGILPVEFVNGMFSTDKLSMGFGFVIILSALLVSLLAGDFLKRPIAQPAEYFSILLFSTAGALMMTGYDHLLMLFLGVETLSIAMYILAGAEKRDLKSNEAALKYFLMGAFATGFLLFGVALLYGATGSFTLEGIREYVATNGLTSSPLLFMGLLFVLIGMLFKVSAAPFHFWTADVYNGAPSLFTAYMSTVVKTAGFAALYKLLSVSFADLHAQWGMILAVVSAVTLVVGNLSAMVQSSAKRTMAFSGISHAGYLLIAVASFQAGSKEAILLYSAAYSVATIMFFAVLMQVQHAKGDDENFEAFNGLAKTNPLLALGGAVSMLSLAGIPLTGGFMGKLYVFLTAFEAGFIWLLIIAVLMSAASIYYYLKLIIAMYFKTNNHAVPINESPAVKFVVVLGIGITIMLGLFPEVITAMAN